MSEGQRPPANRMMLQTFKAKLTGASKGHKLLKKKRDALKAKFQAMMREIINAKLAVGEGLKEASFGYAKAQWASGGDDISATVVERCQVPSVSCRLGADNVAGVALPVFKMDHDPNKDAHIETLGVGAGGAVIQSCRETCRKTLFELVKLASLQTAFYTLDEEIKMTSRRVNALEYVLIPRIEDVVHYIIQEIDEQTREEFFRVKKVVQKKRLKLEAEAKALAAAAALEGKQSVQTPAVDAPSALDTEDSDVVF